MAKVATDRGIPERNVSSCPENEQVIGAVGGCRVPVCADANVLDLSDIVDGDCGRHVSRFHIEVLDSCESFKLVGESRGMSPA